MRVLLKIVFLFSLIPSFFAFADVSVYSPRENLSVKIDTQDNLKFSVYLGTQTVSENVEISLNTSKGNFGVNSEFKSLSQKKVSEVLKPVWGINSEIQDFYNEATLSFEGFDLIFRLYDDAVAYRFKPKFEGNIKIFSENMRIRFSEKTPVLAHTVSRLNTSFENVYTSTTFDELKNFKYFSMPFIAEMPFAKLFITDADVHAYPMLNLQYSKETSSLNAVFAPYPKTFENKHVFISVKEAEDFISLRPASEPTPWRVFVVVKNDKELLNQSIVYKLSRPSKVADTSWIKTGTCAWEWMVNENLEGVDFETGLNYETYKYFIDFAAENKIPFMLFDAGWIADYDDILNQKPTFDIEALVKYANGKNVKSVLWYLARPFNDENKAKAAFEKISKWGVAGVKIDFTDRDDQIAVEFFENTAKLAAEYKLLVDFHGCPKPAGLYRTYPNVINFEGARGNEYNKFEKNMTPDHNINLIFTRFVCGPFDYTPGLLRHSAYSKDLSKEQAISHNRPMARGTMAHQMAMYVMYHSPLQMISDSPTEYAKHPALTKLISACPTTWDETLPLDAALGKYALIARRSKTTWFVAGMADWDGKEIELPLNFLGDGAYKVTILKDTINSNKLADDYKMEDKDFTKSDTLKIKMSKGGGILAKFEKKN